MLRERGNDAFSYLSFMPFRHNIIRRSDSRYYSHILPILKRRQIKQQIPRVFWRLSSHSSLCKALFEGAPLRFLLRYTGALKVRPGSFFHLHPDSNLKSTCLQRLEPPINSFSKLPLSANNVVSFSAHLNPGTRCWRSRLYLPDSMLRQIADVR